MVTADHGGADGHRLDQRCTETLVAAREHERGRTGDQRVAVGVRDTTGSDHPIADAAVDDRPGDVGVDGAGAPEQHQAQLRVGPMAGHHVDQQLVVLVRMRDRRIHDVRPVPQPVALAHRAHVGRADDRTPCSKPLACSARRAQLACSARRAARPRRGRHRSRTPRSRCRGRTRSVSPPPTRGRPIAASSTAGSSAGTGRSTAGARGTAGRARSAGSAGVRSAASCHPRGGRRRIPTTSAPAMCARRRSAPTGVRRGDPVTASGTASPSPDGRRRTRSVQQSVGATSLSSSPRPVSCRTRYSSEPPTSPGVHHNRLTATLNLIDEPRRRPRPLPLSRPPTSSPRHARGRRRATGRDRRAPWSDRARCRRRRAGR